jgi:hypothetical protein
LLQLASDALVAGYAPDRVLDLLAAIGRAATIVADATVAALSDAPGEPNDGALEALAARGRGLLSHGTGRLTIHALGRQLGASDDADAAQVVRKLLGLDA